MALQSRPDATLAYVVGSSGSGKTSWMKYSVRKSRRALAWDGKGIDYGPRDGFEVITSLAQLRARLFEPRHRLSVRVRVTKKNFAAFCALAWVWARYLPGDLLVDEIADVTTPGKAPDEWGEIVRKARSYGTNLYVGTQRPQECDKTIQGNAHVYHCGRMSDADDQAYVARRLLGGIDVARVAALAPLEYIERDVRTFAVTTGRVKFAPRLALPSPSKSAPPVAPTPPPQSSVAPLGAPPKAPATFFDW